MNYEGEDDLIFNTAARCAVCLCLDTSGSMNPYIDELNEGIKLFYDSIRANDLASKSCEIAIVTYDSDVKVVEDFSSIDTKKPKTLAASGSTKMGEGVQKALELLSARKQKYKDIGVDYYQPWLVLMSDGYPDNLSTVKDAQKITKELEDEKKLTIFPIGIGNDVDLDILSDFSNKKKALRLKDFKFADFFEWLGQSVSIVSASKVGDTVKLDTSRVGDIFDIK